MPPRFGLTYYSPELLMSQATPHPHRLDPIDLMEHPLRVIVMVAQSYAGMWRRNGECLIEFLMALWQWDRKRKSNWLNSVLLAVSGYSLLNQIYLYHNVRCRGEMFDRDIQTLQICASLLDPNEYLIQVTISCCTCFTNPWSALIYFERRAGSAHCLFNKNLFSLRTCHQIVNRFGLLSWLKEDENDSTNSFSSKRKAASKEKLADKKKPGEKTSQTEFGIQMRSSALWFY